MRTILIALAMPAIAQNLSVGLIGGFSSRADFQNQLFMYGPYASVTYSTPQRWIVGGTLEYRFTTRFSLEGDGIYRPLGYHSAGLNPDGSLNSISPNTVVTWEFPVLAKYRFAFHGANPFIEAGPSFRTTGNLNSADPSHFGITSGLGIELHARSLNIAPVVRYTRWAADPPNVVRTPSDQVEILVAFGTAPKSNWKPMGSRISLGALTGMNLLGDFRPRLDRFAYFPAGVEDQPLIGEFSQTSQSRGFQFGAVLELQIAGRFSVEGDAIYEQRKGELKTRVIGEPAPGISLLPSDIGFTQPEWKFPVLAKYRMRRERIAPIFELGPTFRIPPGSSTLATWGATAGLGIESRWKRMKIAPVLRYTRWGPESYPEFSRGNPNQLDLLAGFSF